MENKFDNQVEIQEFLDGIVNLTHKIEIKSTSNSSTGFLEKVADEITVKLQNPEIFTLNEEKYFVELSFLKDLYENKCTFETTFLEENKLKIPEEMVYSKEPYELSQYDIEAFLIFEIENLPLKGEIISISDEEIIVRASIDGMDSNEIKIDNITLESEDEKIIISGVFVKKDENLLSLKSFDEKVKEIFSKIFHKKNILNVSQLNVENENMDSTNIKIFMVDDNKIITTIAKEFLKHPNWEFKSVNSSVEALQILEKEKPDLIISDLNMPEVTGLDIIKFVRKSNIINSARIIISSSDQTEEVKAKLFRAGADVIIPKPINKPKLRSGVEQQYKLILKLREMLSKKIIICSNNKLFSDSLFSQMQNNYDIVKEESINHIFNYNVEEIGLLIIRFHDKDLRLETIFSSLKRKGFSSLPIIAFPSSYDNTNELKNKLSKNVKLISSGINVSTLKTIIKQEVGKLCEILYL